MLGDRELSLQPHGCSSAGEGRPVVESFVGEGGRFTWCELVGDVDGDGLEDLLIELREMDGVSRVTGLKAEAESEV